MKKWPYWKRLRFLLVLVAVIAGLTAFLCLTTAIGASVQSSRLQRRIEAQVNSLPSDAVPSTETLANILDDWDYVSERIVVLALSCCFASGFIVLLALLTSMLNKPFRECEEVAQQSPAGNRLKAPPEE